MNITTAGIVSETYYQVQPVTPGAMAPWRSLARGRTEFPEADSAIAQYITPVSGGSYVLDNFPAVELNNVAVQNEVDEPVILGRLYHLHLRVRPYRPDLPASGTVAVNMNALFGAGGQDMGTLGIGDEIILTRGAGFDPVSGSSLNLTVGTPVNLAIELIIIGKEAGTIAS